MILLAASGDSGVSRDKLVGYLWPESDDKRARHRLSDTLHVFRKELGDEALLASGEMLRLNPEAVWTDVGALEEALERGEPETAVELYGGPFLDGVHLEGAMELERWVDGERERYAGLYARALETLALKAEDEGDHGGAAEWRKRLAAQDPYDSRLVVKVMEALAAAGDVANALQHARAHELLLREELEVEPAPEVLEAADRLRQASAGRSGRETPLDVRSPAATAALRRRGALVGPSIALVAGALAVVAGWLIFGERGPASNSLVVLPFENVSGDPADEYFSDGIQDQILTQLSKIGGLSVRGRTSAMQYRDNPRPSPQISEELNVRYILEGGVLLAGETVRVNVQLIDARADEHLWAETYDRELTLENLFAVMSEVTLQIAQELRVTLTTDETARVAAWPTQSLQAYESYLAGRQSMQRRGNREDWEHALRSFALAVRADSMYAAAWAGLAAALGSHMITHDFPSRIAWHALTAVPGIHTTFSDPEAAEAGVVRVEMARLAEDAAERAIAIDPMLADGYKSLAGIRGGYYFDSVGAEEAFLKAIELQPGEAGHRAGYAGFLVRRGRAEEALEYVEQALATEPLSTSIGELAIRIRFHNGQRERALRELEELVEQYPSRTTPLWYLANLQAAVGEYEQAISSLRRQMAMMDEHVADETALLGFIYGMTGQRDSAHAALARLDELEARGVYTSPTIRAWPYSGLGDFDEAFEWLDRAVEERDGWLIYLRTFPAFGPLRSDPRYPVLLRRVGLEM